MNDLDVSTPGYTELASDVANRGRGWQPIGTSEEPFTGAFDGQGYKIKDLFINRLWEDGAEVGLFGFVGEGGLIKNVGVVDVDVTGEFLVGPLVGLIDMGTVTNCYATGSVKGTGVVGGLVGASWMGTIKDSYSTCSVSPAMELEAFGFGGLVGDSGDGTIISSCHASGTVSGHEYVGGLVGGGDYSTIRDCYFTGSVTGNRYVGGLVGGLYYHASVTNSYYNCDQVLINGENVITVGALFDADFEEWLANGKFLDINERLSKEGGYYMINNVNDFKHLLAFGQNPLLKFKLKSDLDLAGEPNFYIPYLAGEFDGNGRKIANLTLNLDFIAHLGLFGYLTPGSKISHLGVENASVAGADLVGGLVGLNAGILDDCYVTGTVSGEEEVGGLTGRNSGDVNNSHTECSITGELHVGGLVGFSDYYGTVTGCHSTGDVTGDYRVGGLVGDGRGTVDSSYSTSAVGGIYYVGGLLGSSSALVTNSYATGSVVGRQYVGGLAGKNYGTVDSSYSTGNVTGDTYIGGLVGCSSWTTVSNSYAQGSVTGKDYVGGLIGYSYGGTVSKCYSTGSVNGNTYVGGLVGENGGDVSASFWDIETSGQSSSAGGEGKTTAEMKDITTFSDAGWDIVAVANPSQRNTLYIWNIVDGETYPFLSWQPV